MARGLDGVQDPHHNVEEMAADYVKELLEFQPEGPYLIAGECIGGIVAYEMAQQLHAMGRQVEFLALLDTIRPDEQYKALVDSIYSGWKFKQVLSHFRRLSALSMHEGAHYLLQKTIKKIRLTVSLSGDTRKANRIRLVEENYPRVLSRYSPRPYPGRVTLILNEETYRDYRHGRWDGLGLGGLDVHVVPGTHVTRLTEHANLVAEQLTSALNESLSARANPVAARTN
jgi:thioesterase domain-containing protein